MLMGLAAIPAGLLIGGLWSFLGVKIAFIASAFMTALATAGFWRFVRP
jgi:hypothetical protein